MKGQRDSSVNDSGCESKDIEFGIQNNQSQSLKNSWDYNCEDPNERTLGSLH